ncbi:hypothetical protein HU200_023586 [Digitaria exilis]|uniref:Uncharacterized protein n=1 Tax=Digitaria exilis TaxID=1010633 RepID=A0A835EU82_9POAL|nr:hypothetical protein HU200_023586 [Digitaria exilis]
MARPGGTALGVVGLAVLGGCASPASFAIAVVTRSNNRAFRFLPVHDLDIAVQGDEEEWKHGDGAKASVSGIVCKLGPPPPAARWWPSDLQLFHLIFCAMDLSALDFSHGSSFASKR